MSKLAVFMIRLATDPEMRDRFRNEDTREGVIQQFFDEAALDADDVTALRTLQVGDILKQISASNQQTDGTDVRLVKSDD